MNEELVEIDASNDRLIVGAQEIRLPHGFYTQDEMTEVVAGKRVEIKVATRVRPTSSSVPDAQWWAKVIADPPGAEAATDEQKAAVTLAQLEAAMKRWGMKPEALGLDFRGLMAFTPDEVPAIVPSSALPAQRLGALLLEADRVDAERTRSDGKPFEHYGPPEDYARWWVCLSPDEVRGLAAELQERREVETETRLTLKGAAPLSDVWNEEQLGALNLADVVRRLLKPLDWIGPEQFRALEGERSCLREACRHLEILHRGGRCVVAFCECAEP